MSYKARYEYVPTTEGAVKAQKNHQLSQSFGGHGGLMSLINDSYEDFYYIAVSMIADGEGGQISAKNDSKEFKAVVRTDQFSETKTAEKSAKNVTYTITTHRNVQLKFNDLIRRKSDGKIFRITSDSRCTPKVSGLDMRQVTAEERT